MEPAKLEQKQLLEQMGRNEEAQEIQNYLDSLKPYLVPFPEGRMTSTNKKGFCMFCRKCSGIRSLLQPFD